MKIKLVFSILFVLLLCLQSSAVEIPFKVIEGYLVIPVKVKKNLTVEMLVNTALDLSMIDGSSAEKLKLGAPSYTVIGFTTGRNDEIVTFYEVSDVSISDEKPVNMFMEMGNLNALKQRIGIDIGGILGSDFFRDKIVKFNFAGKTLSLLNQSEIADKKLKVKQNGFPIVCEMILMSTNKFNKEITLPVCGDVYINAEKMKILFDTGSRFDVSILPAGIKNLKLETPEKGQAKQFEINSLKLQEYEMRGIPAVMLSKEAVPAQYKKGFDGSLGINFLQNFVVTFDFKKKLIALEK